MIKNNALLLFVAALGLLVAACSGEPRFEIKCEIDGLDDGAVEMVYFNGQFNAVTFHGKDSKVTLKGHSQVPALVDVWDGDSTLLFSLIAADGDRISVKYNPAAPEEATVKGSEATVQLWQFCRENAELVRNAPSDELNAAVERFVVANPSSLASTVALMTLYDLNADPVRADSLLNRLDATARNLSSIRDFSRTLAVASASQARQTVRPMSFRLSADSTVYFTPYRHTCSLLVVSDARLDTAVTSTLRSLRKDFKLRSLNIVEVSVAPDSAAWAAQADSATWARAWVPGSYGNQSLINFAIPYAPYYIAVDSTGAQRYRGPSVEEARSTLRSILK